MTDYARVRVKCTYSVNSDYSDPSIDEMFEEELTPSEYFHIVSSIPTGGYTLDLSQFSAITYIVVTNKDTTNFVDVSWTYTDATAVDHSNVQRVPAGRSLVIPHNPKISSDLVVQANTAACICDIIIVGD